MLPYPYKKITLRNGLRVIIVPDKNVRTAAVLVLVGAGSKYEIKELNGISHFLEHMFFKGTKKRPTTLKLAETLDRVGGAYNAFTSKELTGYWAKVDSRHLDLALDWLSDIVLNSRLKAEEIEREKGVIIEEINMYLDTPVKYIEDLWENLLYGDQPAGWKTIGEKENILKFQRKHFLDYLNNYYSSFNTVVAVAGNFSENKVLAKLNEYFGKLNQKPPRQKLKVREEQTKAGFLLYPKKTDQTHLCLGVRAHNLFSPHRYTGEILATILGGNMSSRLFIQLRERMGLAYYAHTSAELYTDSGYLVTQAGVPHEALTKAVNLILREYKQLKEKKIPARELQKAKDYLKGSLVLGLETSDAKSMFYAGQELLTAKILTIKEKFKMLEKVTQEDVRNLAREIFQPEKLNLAVLGPHKGNNGLKKLLKL